jgi:hypothetical protein
MTDDYVRSGSPGVGHFETLADRVRRSGAEPPADIAGGGRPIMLPVGRAAYTPEEWEVCKAFLDSCEDRIQDVSRALTKAVVARLENHEINLGELLREIHAIDSWEMQTMVAECRCRPGESDLPEIPDWKDEEREFLGTKNTWRSVFADSAPTYAVLGTAAAAVGSYLSVPGVVAEEVAARWAPPLIVGGAMVTIMGVVSASLAADPPDDDFADLPVVDVKPRFGVDLSELPRESQAAVTNLIDLAAEQTAVSFALLTAVQRSWGADVAGDEDASARQLEAAADLAERLADVAEGQAAARADLISAVRADITSLVIGQAEVLEHVLPGIVEGPNQTFTQVVNHYGDGNLDAERLWWLMAAQLFNGAVPGEWVFPEELSPPALALAEAREVAYLRLIAEVWRT